MKILRIIGIGLAFGVVGALLTKNRKQVQNQIRYLNKSGLNRLTLRIAGARYSPISLIRHVGRRSGKTYETPIIVEPVPDGFVFALTYGTNVDWYRNVLAAGHATVRWHGKNYALGYPQVLTPASGLALFPLPERTILKLLGIRDFMLLRFEGAH